MNFREYVADVERREALAKKLDTSPAYLYQLGTGHRKASYKFAQMVEEKTKGQFTRHELRPDIFGRAPKVAA